VDPIARRIRRLRSEKGLSLSQLAARASRMDSLVSKRSQGASRSNAVSVSYLSLIENGHKVPNEAVAVALAEALGEDPKIYRAWVRARKHSGLDDAIAAAETLKSLLDESSAAPEAPNRSSVLADSSTRLRVPVIAAGSDPGNGMRPECAITSWRRLDPTTIASDLVARVARPFAYPLARAGAALAGGDHALVLRDWLPLRTEPVYAVRSAGRVTLGRVLWNRRHLVVLPAPGEHDFELIEARDFATVSSSIIGLAIAVRFEPEGDSS
jgi:transcriptional regulator with XRE-family HTH domain